MTTVPDDETLAKVLSRGDQASVGEFRVTVATDEWWWSDVVYEMHGFAPGEVVPTSDLVLAHSHPDDRQHAQAVLDEARCSEEPFAMIHRIVDAQGEGHVVATVGRGRCDDDGTVTEVTGYLLDLTTSVRHLASEEANASIQAAARSRRDIEQAKGVLMMVLGVDDDGAFQILRRLSNDTNTPLRVLAGWLMTSAREAETPSRDAVLAFLRGLEEHGAVESR
ncbi:PAS domain-containing protein [Isoptericola sp. CG 20/1183]|uniref:histidine kinase n=1 Tax=Isoptericola halotolerans TaxID=300560 RepID=A0ABX5E9W6_9MICO|nr:MULTISPECIES: PAS and ANTAR domain-containing protein [Isoptericola]MCK0115707.1 PAS and ANTAR domain-containing protein [Isoptericola sp. S6320L]PRZ02652.1 PAS domain-containing protein [Isoptericola sp. CG 20/1183]PRZ03004.1 PAS domain-containing protein [Isoptericola halotolerans]